MEREYYGAHIRAGHAHWLLPAGFLDHAEFGVGKHAALLSQAVELGAALSVGRYGNRPAERNAGWPVDLERSPTAAWLDSSAVALQVAVGIDIRLYHGWAFRYSFAETTRSNPISSHLSPPGNRMLANFRNLFGFVKYF